ncbi:MAG: hypothetical protein ACP5VS_07330, partial [Desulfomonilaceae bacterium]
RLRRYDEGEKVTMKGPAQQFSDGSLKRPEFEIEWKNNSLKRILDLIQDIGVSLSSTLSGQNVDPELSIRSLGLDVIQKRDTCRTSRKIFDSRHSESIAQLDIDQVSFMCRGRKFTHYEIEIERRAPEDCPVIQKSLEYLKRRFGEFVRLWTLDKLTTVQLICDLFESGNLIGIGPGALLTSSAYEKVHEEFDRRM